MPFTQHTRFCRFLNATGQISTQKKFEVPIVAYLQGLHECPRDLVKQLCFDSSSPRRFVPP